MKFTFDKTAWPTIEEGEKNCFLLTNGLGGYQSLSLIGAVARGDEAFFMSARKAPNVRRHLITKLLEKIIINGTEYVLTSQRMQDADNLEGFRYLEEFTYDNAPVWKFVIGGVTVIKRTVMRHGENTVAVQYEVTKQGKEQVSLSVTPLLRMTSKKEAFETASFTEAALERISCGASASGNCGKVTKGGDMLYFATNGIVTETPAELFGPLYFSQDERDGREEAGWTFTNHSVEFDVTENMGALTCVYSTKPCSIAEKGFEELLKEHRDYQNKLLEAAPLASELGKQLVLSADAYVADRESTNGKTILAGFPFFEDWGRDTMISLPGITMVTGRFDECKSILRTFAKYVKNGLLPNLFPEGGENPMYNSADAPLLFVNAVYEYVKASGDEEFRMEMLPVLLQIVDAYRYGTDFHIGMDEDGLIKAGAGLEQLTWMDVRIGDCLPTPRHGKPVEINAYWYSALRVVEEFLFTMGETLLGSEYEALAEQVRVSFLAKFWNAEEDCLKDVLSGGTEENQVRCNQIWALTQPFTMLAEEQEAKVLKKIREELYTTIGLRTLSPKDAAFHEIYIGPMEQRDRAYHQGTTWAFPLGAYYRACIRYINGLESESRTAKEWRQHVEEGLAALNDWLKEGCIGQIAEIYDGGTPTVSRGCFAQAWSVGELLYAVYDMEHTLKQF